MNLVPISVATALLLVLTVGSVSAQSAENVAVVINDSSAVSQRIGAYYVEKRGIPPSNVLRIRTSLDETIERPAYASTIEEPIGAAIARAGLQDRILYLVLTKGVPLRIAGTAGSNGTSGSVDSELTLLYRRMTGQPVPAVGRVDNPYFLKSSDPAQRLPFTHREHDIYLVTRLDGFTEQDVIALIDRAAAPSTEGHIVLDGRDPFVNRVAESWLEAAAKRLAERGQGSRVILDATPRPARTAAPVLGFYSWGSIDPQNRARVSGLVFAPGALAASFVPADARTFDPPPDEWVPTDGDTLAHQGSGHSLVGDLIREGITGVAGHLTEPYLQGIVRPEILFPVYLDGANLAEAFYLALPYLGWQTVIVGDPLCAPFRKSVLSRSDIEDRPDVETEIPSLFAQRAIAHLSSTVRDAPDAAVRLVVRARLLFMSGQIDEARRLLDRAAELAPRVVQWHLQLASWDETARHFDEAIARYRRVLDVEPNQVIALNNLAYALAVHRNAPNEGLGLAKRAASLAPGVPPILDTVAWIEHLLGNHVEAARLSNEAVNGAPDDAEIRFHAATIHAAVGDLPTAASELRDALRLDPSLEQRQEVRDLRARLAEGSAR